MIVGIINSVIKINANFIPSRYPFCFVFVPKYIELIKNTDKCEHRTGKSHTSEYIGISRFFVRSIA